MSGLLLMLLGRMLRMLWSGHSVVRARRLPRPAVKPAQRARLPCLCSYLALGAPGPAGGATAAGASLERWAEPRSPAGLGWAGSLTPSWWRRCPAAALKRSCPRWARPCWRGSQPCTCKGEGREEKINKRGAAGAAGVAAGAAGLSAAVAAGLGHEQQQRRQGRRGRARPRNAGPRPAQATGSCASAEMHRACAWGAAPRQTKGSNVRAHMPGGSRLLEAGVGRLSLPLAWDAMVSHSERWSVGRRGNRGRRCGARQGGREASERGRGCGERSGQGKKSREGAGRTMLHARASRAR